MSCSPWIVKMFLGILRTGVADILGSAINDYAVDGSKLKSKSARQTAWYASYRASVPGLASVLKELTSSDASTIVSLLAQGWSSSLLPMQGE